MTPPVDTRYTAARLPRWLLPSGWPRAGDGAPALADIDIAAGRIAALLPQRPQGPPGTREQQAQQGQEAPRSSSTTDASDTAALLAAAAASAANPAAPAASAVTTPPLQSSGAITTHDLRGAPVLPALVEAHVHLDKAFTIHRMADIEPGLLGAIAAMHADRVGWTREDVRQRATQALTWAWQAGVGHVRTHVDWWEPAETPVAWGVMRELAADWAGRVTLEQVSLMPLPLFKDRDDARRLAARVAATGPGAWLGGFIHSTHWDPQALRHLLEAAEDEGLDVDLHVDEELEPAARGLLTAARLMAEMRFSGRLVASHACALSVQSPAEAGATLDAMAEVAITVVALPITNLLLQDARTGRTPRLRGLTLVKEARARGIPVLIGSDNVQDPFCRVGSFDPLEAFASGVLVGQLEEPFDVWSEALCRADWLTRGSAPASLPLQPGSPADFLIFDRANRQGFPSRNQPRRIVRGGRLLNLLEGQSA